LSVTVDGYSFEIEVSLSSTDNSNIRLRVNGQDVHITGPDGATPADEMDWFIVNDRPYEVTLDEELQWIRSRWGIFPLKIEDLDSSAVRPQISDGRIRAPIPGQVTHVMVKPGEQVQVGQPVLILAAMKMENEIRSPRSGRVKEIKVTPGQVISLHELMIEIE
jgi:biotin carboxyl carrier protein